MNIRDFSKSLANDFVNFEYHEMADCDDRDTAIVIWTIRCLANPKCEGSAEALAAIIQKREQKELLG